MTYPDLGALKTVLIRHSTNTRKTILLYYDPIFLQHETGAHPENAARLGPTIRNLNSLAMDGPKGNYQRPDWKPATLARIHRLHTPNYVEQVKAFVNVGGYIEQDTVVSEKSLDVALMAAGAVCDAVERIHGNEDKNAFCLVRPPGHHALPDQAMGFCLFNNVAVAARVATHELDYERVLIVDWDVHHGNGTQAMFWEAPDVAYFSMHRAPFYPFTGNANETGTGSGKGTTRNLPIEFGTPREDQLKLFQLELRAFADQFKPQLIFISAGFDAHKNDPIGSLGLESEDFGELTTIVKSIAEQHADGKIISALEGGYNPQALAECIDIHLAVLSQAKKNNIS